MVNPNDSVEILRIHVRLQQLALHQFLLAEGLVPDHVALLAECTLAEAAFKQFHALVHEQVALQVAGLAEDFVAATHSTPVLGVKFLTVGVNNLYLLVPVPWNLRESFVYLPRVTAHWHGLLELSHRILF